MGRIKILYIHHMGALGGPSSSLAYLLEALGKERYEPIVACLVNNPELIKSYQNLGAYVFVNEKIIGFSHTAKWYSLFNPSDWYYLARSLFLFIPSVRETERMARSIKPDIVHLNSLTLAPSAWGAKKVGVPVVWHIRERVALGHMGIRRWILKKFVLKLADEIKILSEYDRCRLISNVGKGVVIPNYVDFQRFDYSIDGNLVRRELGISEDEKVILFMGGRMAIKGIFPLLKALPAVKREMPNIKYVMPGTVHVPSNRVLSRIARRLLPLLGYGTPNQRIDKYIAGPSMQDYVRQLPFRQDIERLIAMADVVVFPSVKPHFARPVIEAEAMAKPVVASRIGGVEELVEDGVTGYLVKPKAKKTPSGAIINVLMNEEMAHEMGRSGLERAERLFPSRISIKSKRYIEGFSTREALVSNDTNFHRAESPNIPYG